MNIAQHLRSLADDDYQARVEAVSRLGAGFPEALFLDYLADGEARRLAITVAG